VTTPAEERWARESSAILGSWAAAAQTTADAEGIKGFPVALMLPGPATQWARSLMWICQAFERRGYTLILLDGVIWAEPTKARDKRRAAPNRMIGSQS